MGFFGLFFLARSDKTLSSLPAVIRTGGEVCHEAAYPDGWRLGQIHDHGGCDDAEGLAAGLVTDTGAPALAMYGVDNDFAIVHIDSPQQTQHWFYLDAEAALAMCEPWDDPPQPPSDEETIEQLMRWADEAGLPASEAALAAALPERPGPFGEGVLGLIAALGVQVPAHEDDDQP